jgi:hypothetical protein
MQRQATRTAWRDQCIRRGMLHLDEKGALAHPSRTLFNKYVTELVTAGWISVNGETVTAVRE